MPFRAASARGAWLATALALVASCSLIDSTRDPMASGDPASADAMPGDDATPGGDATPGEDAARVTCDPGDTLLAATAFNASPLDPASACSVDSALQRDGNPAGLDLLGSTDAGCERLSPGDQIGGCGCVGVDFGAARNLTAIVVRAAPVEDACGGACEGSDCGTGHSFVAWYAVEPGVYTLIGDPDLTSDQLTDYEMAIGQPVRYVAVCREWWSATRDDVAVDAIEGICGP